MGIKITIDDELIARLDEWRGGVPSLNRTALVNGIILEWAEKNPRIRRLTPQPGCPVEAYGE